ncbi:hypothetical protein J437_LFUL006912 [Ladona fulva]|uniref:Fibrous sheath-interacting protein 2 n=1 Tax=Ladona fulva TaxID=123851 RepID=A0A8K0NYL6_LADFU|nr:hypothetical protein J437_LFUL006912 [Ladona fulva]
MVTELLTLRRSTRVHELLNSVPKPKGSIPKNSLPDWTIMDLEQKLPMVKAPDNLLIYSRDFVLDDPYCLDVSLAYDPLHDRHLRNFFLNERNMKRVKELGLVNENGNAICSLKSFNEYRRYLKRVHMDLVKKERERREQLDKERRDIEKAKKYAERDAELCVKREQRNLKMAIAIAKMQREEQLKREDIERRAQRRQRQQYLLEIRRELEKEERRAKGEAFDRRIRDHIEAAAKFQRRKVVSTLRQWNKAEADLRRRRIKRLREKKRIKEEKDIRKWKERMEYQQNRMEYIKELLENEAEDFAYRVNLRNEKVERERKRMDDLLQKIKDRKGNKEVYVQKRRQSRKLAKLVCNKWLKKVSRDDETLDRKTVEQTVFKTMLATKSKKQYNDNIIDILEEVRIRLAEQVYLPPAVSDVIDKMLNNAIEQFLWKKVDLFINDIISRGIQTVKNIHSKKILSGLNDSKSQLTRSSKRYSVDKTRRRTTEIRRLTDYEPKIFTRYSLGNSRLSQLFPKPESNDSDSPESKPTASYRHSSAVSFGKVFNIGVTEQEFSLKEMKNVRDRPPTPVPSLSDLAEAVFESPMIMNKTDKSAILKSLGSGIDMTERKELIEMLKYLSKNISQRVYTKLQKEIKHHEDGKDHTSVTQDDIVKTIVNGIIKQGFDYSQAIDELESISQSITGIISRNIWKMEKILYKGKRDADLPYYHANLIVKRANHPPKSWKI